jgi:hypothetical protein
MEDNNKVYHLVQDQVGNYHRVDPAVQHHPAPSLGAVV